MDPVLTVHLQTLHQALFNIQHSVDNMARASETTNALLERILKHLERAATQNTPTQTAEPSDV